MAQFDVKMVCADITDEERAQRLLRVYEFLLSLRAKRQTADGIEVDGQDPSAEVSMPKGMDMQK